MSNSDITAYRPDKALALVAAVKNIRVEEDSPNLVILLTDPSQILKGMGWFTSMALL